MNHLKHHLDVGDASLFPLAREAILTWALQESAGVIVRPARRVHPGQVVDLRLDPLWRASPRRLDGPRPSQLSPRRLRGRDLTVPVGSCTIIEVIDEERRVGFVYRTLPGHLESGEQRFLVAVEPEGRLVVSIVSDSAPGHPLLRAAAPVSVAAQAMMASRYAEGLKRILHAREDPQQGL